MNFLAGALFRRTCRKLVITAAPMVGWFSSRLPRGHSCPMNDQGTKAVAATTPAATVLHVHVREEMARDPSACQVHELRCVSARSGARHGSAGRRFRCHWAPETEGEKAKGLFGRSPPHLA